MDNLAKDFISTFLAGFIFLMVFMANPAFAHITQENYSSTVPSEPILDVIHFADTLTPSTISTTLPTNTDFSPAISPGITVTKPLTSASNTCAVSTLSPTEAKGIMDLTSAGFNAKSISDGTPKDANADSNVKDFGPQSLIGQDTDGKKAVKVDAPSVSVSADRFSFLAGNTFEGPFGVGLILDDTLRVGRCELPADQQKECKITQSGLFTRTSGVGFKSDMVNAFQSIKGVGSSIAELNLSADDVNKMKSKYLDINSNDFKTGTFPQGEQIINSIKTNQYNAKNATTCNNNSCTISSYSAFDKYFNAWLTTDMAVFNIGPTVLGKANKFFLKAFKTSGQSQTSSWMSNVARLREKFVGAPQALLKATTMPASTTIGQARIARFKTLVTEEGFEDILKPLYINKKLFSTGAGGAVSDITKPESPIWKFTPEKRGKFFEAIEHLTAYARENLTLIEAAGGEYAAAKGLANAIADPLVRDAALKAAKIEYGKKVAIHMDDWDEILALDFEDWLKDKEEIFSIGGLAVRQAGITRDMEGYVDLSTAPPFNLKKITQKFGEEGSWSGWAGSADAGAYKVAQDGVSLELYRIKPEQLVTENVALQDLKFHVAKMGGGTYSVKLPNGKYIPLNSSSIDFISGQPQIGATVNIYESAYVPAGVFTPEDFATRITHQRIVGRPRTALRNMEDIRNGLVQNDFASRKYYSLLDKQFAEEGDMLKTYFKNPQTAIWKGTVLPIAYWQGKRGFGNEDYSMFMLPDTWTTTTVSQGSDILYKDSFIDFYANEGSDQGDMFKRAFNSVPLVWNKIIEAAASTNQFTSDLLTKASGGFLGSGGMRDTVGDIAFYSHNENCAGCTLPINYTNGYFVVDGFNAGVSMQAFMLEAADEATKKKTGTTLISYTHHSDISGKTTQIEGGKIDLVDSQKNAETCDAILKKYNLGMWGNSAGGVLGITENAAYFFGIGPGLIATLVQQMTVGRALQDCIDDKEGYYIHYYAPPLKEAAATKSKEVVSNETVSTALSDMTSKLDSFVKGQSTNVAVQEVTSNIAPVPVTPGNPVENSMDKLKDQFQTLTTNINKSSVLQAAVELMAPSSGTLRGKDVFYVWIKGKSIPNGYRTIGQDVLTDGNMSVSVNREKGTVEVNGKQIIGPDKADHTRMAVLDTDAGAEFIPVTLNKVAAPMNDSTVFELNTYGDVRVLNSSVLNCIQRAIFDQVGITYTGDELTQVFGELKSLQTESYGSVFARGGKIMLEGSGPRAEGAGNSKFIVNGYWNSKLAADANNSLEAGKLKGMAFEHGSIVVNTQTNELIVYLRQHADSVLSSNDVKGLKATPTTIVDAETGCTQPALDLEAIPQLNDDLGAMKVSNFNTSMDKLGPFTQFTTPTKIYEFYSKKDANTGGECKTFFRVRDKETGKILTDSEIVGGIKVNDDGSISFATADGKQHNLLFDAENGVPKLTYNGGTPETLLSAQGPNGSFWYDPEKGLWYPENGLAIPLNQSLKDNGVFFSPDKSGNVTGTGVNPMTFNIGQQDGSGFNIPSMPETVSGIVLFASAFLIIAFFITQRTSRTKKKN